MVSTYRNVTCMLCLACAFFVKRSVSNVLTSNEIPLCKWQCLEIYDNLQVQIMQSMMTLSCDDE